jgi:glycosyltransferase involved in cell wall biosynthesis
MKILHVNTRDGIDGASRGVYTLHQGLRQVGVDSQMLVARKYSQDPTVHLPTATYLSRVLHALRMWREKRPLAAYDMQGFFSPAAVSAHLQPALRRLNPDLIHLHWVNHGFVRPEDLPTWNRPLVWTLRDMWPLTGGCHSSGECDRYQVQCGRCPQLRSNSDDDISHIQWQRKQRVLRTTPLHFVTLSTWLADCLRASPLSKGHSIQVIPNAINSDVFAPQPKAQARAQLGLPADRKIVLFGATTVTDENKGYKHLIQAIQQLATEQLATEKNQLALHLATFGQGDISELHRLPIATTNLGYIRDNTQLAALYSAADVMVVPSAYESFGKTAAEALACGTPVVCFDSTGLKDIVEHQECGYRAQPFSSQDLAQGIAWVLADDVRHAALARRGRAKVIEEFSLTQVASQYKTLYTQVIQDRLSSVGS